MTQASEFSGIFSPKEWRHPYVETPADYLRFCLAAAALGITVDEHIKDLVRQAMPSDTNESKTKETLKIPGIKPQTFKTDHLDTRGIELASLESEAGR